MFLIGFAGLGFLAGIYCGVLAFVLTGFVMSAFGRFCGLLCRSLAALSLGLIVAPPSCLFLFPPPRDEIAFFGPLGAGMILGWALHWGACAAWSRSESGLARRHT